MAKAAARGRPIKPLVLSAQGAEFRPIDLITLAASTLYFIVMPSTPWQGTVGKKLLNLRIVDSQGGAISLGTSMLRFLGQIISALTLGLGFTI
jgi:uncharacterized RDD family membrane protein YckC